MFCFLGHLFLELAQAHLHFNQPLLRFKRRIGHVDEAFTLVFSHKQIVKEAVNVRHFLILIFDILSSILFTNEVALEDLMIGLKLGEN